MHLIDIHKEVTEHLAQFESEVGKVSEEARSIFTQFADRFANDHQTGVVDAGADTTSEVLVQANDAVTALQAQLAISQGQVTELTAQLAGANSLIADDEVALVAAHATIARLQDSAGAGAGEVNDSAPSA